jgi:predicted permease
VADTRTTPRTRSSRPTRESAIWGQAFAERLLQDLRFGWRVLARSPGSTAIAILTLALGVGANTALFSVIKGVLIEPLPFPDPGRLLAVYEKRPQFEQASISYPNFLDWQTSNHAFAAMASYRRAGFILTGRGEGERVGGEMISADLLPMLGVKPVLGHTFTAADDRLGAAPVALISAGFWHRKLGSAPNALGQSLILNGKAHTIVGVVPASFHLALMNFLDGAEIYVPVGQWDAPQFRDRSVGTGLNAIGRLAPGVTLAQARADMAALTRGLAAAYPKDDTGIGATLVPLKQKMVGDIQPFLLVLFGAVCFVLLIACVNVANLLLARSTGRTREFAVRAALGASQGRVVRQLLTESLLLGIAGGGFGLLLSAWGTRAALAALPDALPRAEGIGIDAWVLLFTFAVSVAAGVAFGVAPALKTSQPDLQATLKEGGRGASGTRHRALGALVVMEVALALVLLVGAGLMIRSLARLFRVDPGFDASRGLLFSVALPPAAGTPGPVASRAAWRRLHAQLASVPGVEAVSLLAGALPMGRDEEDLFWIAGRPTPTNDDDVDSAHPMQAQLYAALMQLPDRSLAGGARVVDVMARAAGEPLALFGAIRRAAARTSREEVVFGGRSLDAIISRSLAARRFSMILLVVFAGLALLLASVGIYGVIAYVVGQRTHEIGIRMALGARRRDVLLQVLGQGGRLALAGTALGVAAALAVTRLMAGLLFGVDPTDPATFAAVAVLLCGMALAACYLPARRATRLDPVVALRQE